MLSQASILRSLALFLPLSILLACNSSSGGSSSTASSTTGVTATGFSPASGSIGTLVLVSGKGFSTDPFQNTVRFGGKAGVASTVEVATATTLLTRVPIGAKAGKIFVSSPAGESLTADDFLLIPQLTTFNPAAAAVGSLVEILGSGFAEVPTDNVVSLNGLSVPVVDGDSTKVVVALPVGATTGTFVVSSGAGSASKGPFVVLPSITGANAAFGLPGTPVTISGFNFRAVLTDNQVAFNGTPASVTAADYFSVTAIAPAGFTTGPITVTTPDGTAIGPDFILPQTPSVLNFTPSSGVVGTAVSITGTNFLPGVMTVKFNGVAAASVTNQTTTSLDTVVPAGAGTGPIEVAHPFASALSSTNFTVLLPPTVTTIDPIVGSPGTVVHVTGTNFDAVTPSGNTVTFGAAGAVASISNVTTTGLDATVPANAVTGPVTVTTAAGSASSSGTFRVAFQRFFVSANQSENTISVFQQDASTGDLFGKSYAFTGAGTLPRAVAVSPNAGFVFVSLEGTSEIAVYALSANGLLTLVQKLGAGATVAGLAVHPSGNYLYVANPSANQVSAYSIASNGVLTLISGFSSGLTPVGVAMHPNGGFLYAPCAFNGPNGNSISVFSVGPTGSLSLVERKGTGTGPSDFQIHPNGLFAYGVAATDCTVRAYTIAAATGKLTLVNTTGTGPLGSTPVSFSIEPTGKRAFVTNQTTNDTISYSIDQVTGALSIPASVALLPTGGQGPSSITTDYGNRVYITNKTSNDVSLFSVNPSTGVMTLQRTMKGRQGPNALVRVDAQSAVTVTPRFVLATNSFNGALGNSVSSYQVGSNGALTPNGLPTATGNAPVALAVDPAGQLAYAANFSGASGTSFLSQYTVDAAGALIPNGNVNVGAAGVAVGNAKSLTIDPSGRFLYCGNQGAVNGDGAVSAFTIDRSVPSFGALAPMASSPILLPAGGTNFNSNSAPSMTVNPSGNLLYVLSFNPQRRVFAFSINPADGSMTLLPTGEKNINTLASQAVALAVHPNGRYLYVADQNTSGFRVVVFDLLADGAVNNVIQNVVTGGSSVSGVTTPTALAFHPNGAFLYVTNSNSDTVTTFSVAPAGSATAGQLTRLDADAATGGVQDTATGDLPAGASVDPSGKYLYVTNSGTGAPDPNSISMYAIGANGLPVLVSAPLALATKAPMGIAVVAQYQ